MISALEHLEALSGERDQERATIDSLQSQVKHLELEDSKKLEERQRNAKELEQVEEHYKQETRDLLSTIKKLQDENRKLASSLAAATERDSAFSEDGKPRVSVIRIAVTRKVTWILDRLISLLMLSFDLMMRCLTASCSTNCSLLCFNKFQMQLSSPHVWLRSLSQANEENSTPPLESPM